MKESEVKYPCASICGEEDHVIVTLDFPGKIYLDAKQGAETTEIALDCEQVKDLRDRLTTWLEESQ